MGKHRKHVPQHRDPQAGSVARARRAAGVAVRNAVVLTSLSAAATGSVVTGGVLLGNPAAAQSTEAVSAALPSPVASLEAVRVAATEQVSRADRREATDPAKAAALASSESPGEARTKDLTDADPQVIAQALMSEYGFSDEQYPCLDSLFISESGWQLDADNPTSSAYGIPQALTRLHDLPEDYMTSAEAQIRWGLDYIRSSYGTPCSAWAFKQKHNWY